MDKIDKRSQCHNLVNILPESALDETLEVLAEHLKFYKDRDQLRKNPPKPSIVTTVHMVDSKQLEKVKLEKAALHAENEDLRAALMIARGEVNPA